MSSVVRELKGDGMRAALPRAEAQIVARFVAGEPELHAVGARERVHRKAIRGAVRIAMVRLPLGAVQSVLGASAAAIAGTIVPLEELWGGAAIELRERLRREPYHAAPLIEQAIATRSTLPTASLVRSAAERLREASVGDVARELGVSERHLRRVFRDAVGMSPKSFARLARFHRAVEAARRGESWARIAAATGYFDQAHLIGEFHAITGTTPRAFMTELVDAVG
jgi:AraC-like DNA-binding protein